MFCYQGSQQSPLNLNLTLNYLVLTTFLTPLSWGVRNHLLGGSKSQLGGSSPPITRPWTLEFSFLSYDSILFCYFPETFGGQRFWKWTRVKPFSQLTKWNLRPLMKIWQFLRRFKAFNLKFRIWLFKTPWEPCVCRKVKQRLFVNTHLQSCLFTTEHIFIKGKPDSKPLNFKAKKPQPFYLRKNVHNSWLSEQYHHHTFPTSIPLLSLLS